MAYKGNGGEIISGYYHGSVKNDELVRNQKMISKTIVESGALFYTEIIEKIYHNKVKNELQHLEIDNRYMNQLLDYVI